MEIELSENIPNGKNNNMQDSNHLEDVVLSSEEEDILLHKPKPVHSKTGYICKLSKLSIMIIVITIFFVVELVIGIVTNSLSLVGSAIHLLSDSFSLIIGLVALVLSRKVISKRFPFGWGRTEILGAMSNSVFMLAVVFFIFVEAMHSIMEIEVMESPFLVLGVGIGGLLVNIFGMILVGHNHEHNKSSSNEENITTRIWHRLIVRNVNMAGIFIHIFGDFLGSVVVIIVATLNIFFPPKVHFELSPDLSESTLICDVNCFVMYMDPVFSLLIAVIILVTLFPILFTSSKILMQCVPSHVDVSKIMKEIEEVMKPEKIDFHDLQIWHLYSEEYVASMKVGICSKCKNFKLLAKRARNVLQKHRICNVTIEPIFFKHGLHNDCSTNN